MGLSQAFHKEKRRALAERMQNNSVFFLEAKDTVMKGDSEHFDFADENIFYFTGIEQEKTKLILIKNKEGKMAELLFIENKDPKIEQWVGKKLTQAQATKLSGIKNVYFEKDFETFAKKIFSHTKTLYYFKNPRLKPTSKSTYELHYQSFAHAYRLEKENFYPHVAKIRQRKDAQELALMETAMHATAKAFKEVMKNVKKFKTEQEVEAMFSYIFTKDSCTHAYHPIVASGKDGCTLHYVRNNKPLQKGELLLIDAAAQYCNYKTDVTRTFPVSGKFTKRQKEVYQAVLDVQKDAIKRLKPGLERREWEQKNLAALGHKLVNLKLITQEQLEKNAQIIRKFYPHSTGHFLGLDTHDAGEYSLPFQAGEVFTVEPGIYIPKEGIGVRIEDDVLITEKGRKVLSRSIPKEITQLEKAVSRRKTTKKKQ